MELFEAYYGDSVYDILRESLTDELDVIRAMHNYEMKSIYMEAAKEIDEDALEDEIDEDLEEAFSLLDEEPVMEGQNSDSKAMYKADMVEIKQLAKDAKKMAKSGDYTGASKAYKNAASKIRASVKKIEKLDPSWDSTIIGAYIYNFKSMGKALLLAIPTLGLSILYQSFKNAVLGLETLFDAFNKARKGDKLTATDFNLYVKRLTTEGEKLAKSYDKLAAECAKKKSGVKESYEYEIEDVLTEAAGDVFARMKIAISTFFQKLMQWVKNIISSLTQNVSAAEKFAAKHKAALSNFNSTIKPDGYKVYTYANLALDKAPVGIKSDTLKSYIRAAIDGDSDKFEDLSQSTDDIVREMRQKVLGNNSFESLDASEFTKALTDHFRGNEIVELDSNGVEISLRYLEKSYRNNIKYYNETMKALKDGQNELTSTMKELEKYAKNSGEDSQKAIKLVNAIWTQRKRVLADTVIVGNVYRNMLVERAAVAKRIINQALKESGKK